MMRCVHFIWFFSQASLIRAFLVTTLAVILICSPLSVLADTDSDSDLDADNAWQDLMTGGERLERMTGENSLAYFMRQVESADIRLREKGLEFWENYPNDPRRYNWLILTVHMPPHYAKCIDEWARNETLLEPNKAAVDRSAIKTWNKIYVSLRSEFWHAEDVTEQQRRFLWVGELEQSIYRAKEAHDRGENVDAAAIIDQVIQLAVTYPKPLSENDKIEFNWGIELLIHEIDQSDDVLGLDKATKMTFAARLLTRRNCSEPTRHI